MTINLPGKCVLFLYCATSPRTGTNWWTWPVWMVRVVPGGKLCCRRMYLRGLNPTPKSRSHIYKRISKETLVTFGNSEPSQWHELLRLKCSNVTKPHAIVKEILNEKFLFFQVKDELITNFMDLFGNIFQMLCCILGRLGGLHLKLDL